MSDERIDLSSFTGHTPGPWVPKWSKYVSNTFIVQAGMPSNRLLASFDGDGDGPDNQSLADARLIAAAPDLLAEIERLRAEVDRLTLERDDLDAIRNRENDAGARYIAKLATECNGLREQHNRDSVELRRLCAERDELRQQRDDLIADLAKSQRERSIEREHLEQVMVKRDEAVAQRDDFESALAALRKRVEDAPVVDDFGNNIMQVPAALSGKRVALVVLD